MPIYLKIGIGPDPVEAAQDETRAARAEAVREKIRVTLEAWRKKEAS